MASLRAVVLAGCLAALASASPAPTPHPQLGPSPVLDAPIPNVTPFRVIHEPTKTLQRRADILSKLSKGVNSVLSVLGTDVPSYVASGIPNYFQNFPTKGNVESQLGITDDQLNALPTQVLNLPSYANWTESGWSVRFHGNVYLQPNTSEQKLNQLANVFVPGDLNQLPPDQQAQARNVTAEIFVVQQGNKQVNMLITPTNNTAGAKVQNITLPYNTTDQGDFDVFVDIDSTGLKGGNSTQEIQTLNTYADGATLGNATAYLVPVQGFTIVSDIDDILRITKIYQPKQGLLNSFARPYVPWENMPDIYANWSRSIPNMHFHYLTTTPEQVTRNYMNFIYKTYPLGSFDTRPLNFSDIKATLAIREYLLNKIFETYPKRKFILVADTSNSDVMKDYPEMALRYPDNIQCILLRNTSATDDCKFPYNTKGFKDVDPKKYMFFRNVDDLINIDITGDDCRNTTFPQNITFGYQDELLGIHGSGGSSLRASWTVAVLGAVLSSLFLLL